ncbi:hypothetical protein HJFPF1_07016 [Paramyrothecium foliicola]|nr:hypothetical protein HJFPF1_07016 [Paramyrothecium foliicola]
MKFSIALMTLITGSSMALVARDPSTIKLNLEQRQLKEVGDTLADESGPGVGQVFKGTGDAVEGVGKSIGGVSKIFPQERPSPEQLLAETQDAALVAQNAAEEAELAASRGLP